MSKKECIAMLLAGGQGSRLGALTSNVAKPAVSFGGKFRIIDFALSNCANSGVTTVGVLTQYRPYLLHNYIGTGGAWNLDDREGGVSILPPYATQTGGAWYEGTADAVTQNLGYIEQNDPEYVLILSGDQLYRMDYADMLATHKKNDADLTIAVMPVPWEEASRFGIITADGTGRITKFTEKPKQPDSNLASMGIYIFSTDLLVRALKEDAVDQTSEHDFGKNVIPKLLGEGKRLFTYEFNGFWRDVGTISSYHESDACSDLPPDTDNSGHHRRPPQDRVARIVCPPIRDDAPKDAVRDDAELPIPTDRSPGISHARVPPSIHNPFSVDYDPNNGLCIAHHRSLSHRNPDPCPDPRNTTGRKKSENLAPFDPRVHGHSHGANTRRRSDYNDHS